jgi:hypothetical protein
MKNCKRQLIIPCIFFFFIAFVISGCSGVRVSDYKGIPPTMTPESFFDGNLTAHGTVKNRKGKVIRYFNATIKAYWQDGIGTLEEDFLFNDGEKQQRIWKLVKNPDGSYTGTAGDVKGDAKGDIAGNSMFLEYVLQVAYGDSTVNISIDDRMYLVDPNILINESEMTKFGFKVGEINLVILKENQ